MFRLLIQHNRHKTRGSAPRHRGSGRLVRDRFVLRRSPHARVQGRQKRGGWGGLSRPTFARAVTFEPVLLHEHAIQSRSRTLNFGLNYDVSAEQFLKVTSDRVNLPLSTPSILYACINNILIAQR